MTEESNGINEFEQALRESLDVKELKPGDVIEGTIVAIHGDVALVDVSGKSEAVLERAELDDLGTGDPVEVVVYVILRFPVSISALKSTPKAPELAALLESAATIPIPTT